VYKIGKWEREGEKTFSPTRLGNRSLWEFFDDSNFLRVHSGGSVFTESKPCGLQKAKKVGPPKGPSQNKYAFKSLNHYTSLHPN
jgi:hypothetical protein